MDSAANAVLEQAKTVRAKCNTGCSEEIKKVSEAVESLKKQNDKKPPAASDKKPPAENDKKPPAEAPPAEAPKPKATGK